MTHPHDPPRLDSTGGSLFNAWCMDHPMLAVNDVDAANYVMSNGMMQGLDPRLIAYAAHVISRRCTCAASLLGNDWHTPGCPRRS